MSAHDVVWYQDGCLQSVGRGFWRVRLLYLRALDNLNSLLSEVRKQLTRLSNGGLSAAQAGVNVMEILQPPGWNSPKGYSNGIVADGRFVFVAGQVGTDAQMKLVSDGFVEQAEQALKNIVAVLNEAAARPEHLTRLTWYVTDMRAYLSNLKELGLVYRRVIGNHYPVMALVGVTALVFADAKVEIEATAVVPATAARS